MRKACLEHQPSSRAFSQHESTVGAAVTIAWHDYRAGSAEQRPEQLELWDVGGAAAHRPASTVFLDSAAGVILVHDLTNSKSEVNLGQWLSLVNGDRRVHSSYSLHSLIADIESSNVPILVVGTKLDLAPDRSKAKSEHSQDRSRVRCAHDLTLLKTFQSKNAKVSSWLLQETKSSRGTNSRVETLLRTLLNITSGFKRRR